MDEHMHTPDAVRVALPQLAAILAPDRTDITALLSLVLDDPETYVGTYPDIDYLCSEEGDLARSGLLEMLDGTEFEIGPPLVANLDWRADVQTVQRCLASLDSCPAGLSWNWYSEFATATEEYPDDTVDIAGDFLTETGNQGLRLGAALISVTVGDSYYLAWCPAAEAEHVISLLAAADYEGSCILRS
ncbi:DUF6630 family protein [Nocardia tengchongensis]|uniref:DUF6630 family protein n=1 Tax=Nocardia tengchongensis TaxID=2055889 RepID=UPI0036B474F9